MVYGYQSDAPAVKAVAGVIPYPVERVGGGFHFVTYKAYLFEVDANKKAIQNNAKLNNQPAVDFKSADGKKQIVDIKKHALDKLKSDELTAQLARKYKVTVSNKEVNDLVNQFYTRYGGKDTLLKTLKEYYGWNLNDLKSVIRKQLLAKKLEEKVAADPKLNAQTKAKAADIAKQIKAGGDFATIAKASSQASDAANGGDLGTFTKGQVPEEIQKALDATPVGGVSDPVKTQYGYEIIKVNTKSGDSYSASHILVKSTDYTTWFNDQLKAAKVNVYIVVK
jgi:foldase protein PrsA